MKKGTTIVHLDFETYSECDLKACGAWVYAEHPSTEVLTLSYSYDDSDVVHRWRPGMKPPAFLLPTPDDMWQFEFKAWNSFFEYCIWHLCLKWPEVEIERWHDTMAQAAAMGLPLALGKCGEALGLPADKAKDKRGRYLIQRLCKPNRGKRITDPDLLNELYDYCDQDVIAERAIEKHLNPLSKFERRVWIQDQIMNIRGVKVDVGAAKDALEIIQQETEKLNAEAVRLTGGALDGVSRRDAVMEYFAKNGYPLNSYTKGYLRERLERGDLPDKLARLLEIRLQTGKTSNAKYQKLIDITASDGRAHGLLQYHAAMTGRWGGRLFQPQNLPRPTFDDTDLAISLFDHCDNDVIRMFYGDPLDALSSCLRGMIIASKGKKLAVSDYSAIEARVLAWIAGQKDVIEVFRGHGKIYEHTASQIYGLPWQEIGKSSQERFIGKVATLALGYQGGVKAFTGMAESYGVVIPEDDAEKVVGNWRAANRKIKKFWYSIETAAINAVEEPGKRFSYRGVQFCMVGPHLYCKLPSGRNLCYPFAHFTQGKFKSEQLTYWGVDAYTKKWSLIQTYGGKLTENIVQAISRDLIAEALLRIEDHGYELLLSVHDEIIGEKEDPDMNEFDNLMCVLPDWAAGLPINAEGFIAERYRK